MFIDVHCHLDTCEDITKALENARKKDVKVIINQGVNKESNRKSLALASKYKEIKAALGFYPSDALKHTDKEIDEEIKFIRKNREKIAAIGEVGIDLKESLNFERQEKIFREFVKLSMELDKPVIIHSRKAEKEVIEILEDMNAKKVVMHCFSGRFNLVKRIEQNGWMITVPTNVKNSEQFQSIAREVNIKQLLCETDSPYLHPDKLFPNEPSNVVESYRKIAELKVMTLKEVEKQIEENYKKLFLS